MQPESAVINFAGTLQLVGIAIIVVMLLLLGYKVATGGAKGFAFALTEIGSLVLALIFIVRPNDVFNLLLKAVGGVQTVSMPH
jgi:hypothetical protein